MSTPTRSKWVTGAFPKDVPDELNNVPLAVSSLTDILIKSVEAARTFATAASVISTQAVTSVEQAIQEAGDNISKLIEDLLSPASTHMLIIDPTENSFENVYNIVESSVADTLDPNRPIYEDKDYVAGLVVLAYDNTLAALLKKLIDLNLVIGTNATRPDKGIIPVPRNFRASVITRPNTVSSFGFLTEGFLSPVAVKLSWDPQPLYSILGIGSQRKISKINVYRSEERFDNQSDVSQFLYKSYDFNATTQALSTFVDTDVEEDKTYYYAMSFSVELDGVELQTSIPSRVIEVKTSTKRISYTSSGSPPNWVSTTSPIRFIPALDKALTDALVYSTSLTSSVKTQTSQLQPIINMLDIIEQRINNVNQIIKTASISLIKAITSIPASGISIFTFSGTGGTQGFLDVFGEALQAQEDEAPKITDSSLVGGYILIGGGRNATEVKAVESLIKLLTEGNSSTNTAVKEALESLEEIKEAVEKAAQDLGITNEESLINKLC